MTWPATLLALAVAMMGSSAADAKPGRSSTAVAQFKRHQPCPANGAIKGRCPGYVVDHVRPLCAGGADAAANMQWQSIADAKRKDREERLQCRTMRRSGHG